MPYALCPRRPMPARAAHVIEKGYMYRCDRFKLPILAGRMPTSQEFKLRRSPLQTWLYLLNTLFFQYLQSLISQKEKTQSADYHYPVRKHIDCKKFAHCNLLWQLISILSFSVADRVSGLAPRCGRAERCSQIIAKEAVKITFRAID